MNRPSVTAGGEQGPAASGRPGMRETAPSGPQGLQDAVPYCVGALCWVMGILLGYFVCRFVSMDCLYCST